MFGALNERIVYFFKFPPEAVPVMLRCTEKMLVGRASNIANRLWQTADKGVAWRRHQPSELPAELRKQVEMDIAAVHAVAGQTR